MVTITGHADSQQDMLAGSPMTRQRWLAILLCVFLNAMDGFDVLSISFASPGIAAEWRIDKALLGIVLSMELVGMAAGALVLGQLADRRGRVPIMFLCATMLAFGMLATAQVQDVAALAATRLFTGLGIGGMLATISALVAEYANDRWRNAVVSAVAAGYPMGAIAGGTIASLLLIDGGWRDVFWLGAGMSLVMLPLIPLLLPEPVGTLLRRHGHLGLAKVNRSLRRLGHPEILALTSSHRDAPRPSVWELLSPGYLKTTVLLTAAYFLHFMTFYFILKWVPKIVVDMGFSPSRAGAVLVWANVGGVLGGFCFSLLSLALPLRRLLIGAMLVSTLMVVLFGQGQSDLRGLASAAALAGFFTNAAVVGLFALVASSFPTGMRAGGTGFVIGFGRFGAAVGPIAGGFLFQAGSELPLVAAVMATGSLLAALAVLMLPKPSATES